MTGEDGNIQIVRGQFASHNSRVFGSDFSREFNDYNEVRAVIESQTDLLSEFEGTEPGEGGGAGYRTKIFIVDGQLSFEGVEEATARTVLAAILPRIYANVGQQNPRSPRSWRR